MDSVEGVTEGDPEVVFQAGEEEVLTGAEGVLHLEDFQVGETVVEVEDETALWVMGRLLG